MTATTGRRSDAETVQAPAVALAPLPRRGIFDHDLRRLDLPDLPEILPGLLWAGVTIVWSAPGVGKTFLTQTIAQHLGHCIPMAGFDTPETPVRVWIIDFESSKKLIQDRSFLITKPGNLPTDYDDFEWDGNGGIKYALDQHGQPGIDGQSWAERFLSVRAELEEARESGQPISLLVIDTLKKFIGSPPHGVPVNDFENKVVSELNRLGTEYECAIVLLHHANKKGTKEGGEFSGSTGISGAVETMIRMHKNPDKEHEILLTGEKVRNDREFQYALITRGGVPQFTDEIASSQAGTSGSNRAVLDQLHAHGPMTLDELCDRLRDMLRNTIRSVLKRLRCRGLIRYNTPQARGRWVAVDAASAVAAVASQPAGGGPALSLVPALAPAARSLVPLCASCGERMTLITPGQTTHPGCDQEDAPQDATSAPLCPAEAPAGVPEVDEAEPVVVNGWDADDALLRSIQSSRLHPRWNVHDQLDREPWTLITEQMDGQHHQWKPKVQIPDGATVSILDRRKSYLATASDVSVAVSTLSHTGPLEFGDSVSKKTGEPVKVAPRREDGTALSGIVQIAPVKWDHLDKIAHPLGWSAGNGADPVWITWPHLLLLVNLFNRGDLAELPVILDSWTGRAARNLFARFGLEAKDVLLNGGPEAELALKLGYGKAVRKVWPKTVFSKIVRPDWHQAWEAEAAVRNWVVAWNVMRQEDTPHTLIRIANVDATHWLSPADADTTWCPPGYTIGDLFGHVAHKDDVAIKDVDPATGRVRRAANGGPVRLKVPSPVTAEQYGRRIG